MQADASFGSLMSWWPYNRVSRLRSLLTIHIAGDTKAETIDARQQPYISACVPQEGVTHEHPALLPLRPLVHITHDEPDKGNLIPEHNIYGSLVGSMIHLGVCAKPEMPFAALKTFSPKFRQQAEILGISCRFAELSKFWRKRALLQ